MEEHPILGIDYGDARIGIAATDPLGIIAHPVETIHLHLTNPLQRISELCNERQIKKLILGLPLRIDGSEGDSAKKVRKFGETLSSTIPEPPLEFVDESMTTIAASEKLHQAGKNTKKQKAIIDQAAAVEILNAYLQGQI